MFLFENERNIKTRIERSEIRVTNLGGLEVCRGSVGEVWGRCVGVCWGASGCAGEVCWGRDDARGLELAPLYYPDTLVNQDTCLGIYS